MHHHEHPGDLWDAVEQICDERSRDVVGKVRDQGPVVVAEQRAPVDLERIGFDHAHANRLDHFAQHRHEAAVDLDGGDIRAGLRERERQRPEAGADLDHTITRTDLGKPGDAAHRVGVDDEVLPECAARVESVRRQQLGDVPSAEGHQVMRTLMMPAPTGAISTNCSSSRSMIALP